MNILLRYAIVGVMVIAAIAVVAVCAESAGEACAHAFCRGTDRSRLLSRLVRRLTRAFASTSAIARSLFAAGAARIALAADPFLRVATSQEVSPLRI